MRAERDQNYYDLCKTHVYKQERLARFTRVCLV